ncbi:Hypothetical protein CINCED_3A007140 [Cinara cedri]|uniref:Uncharacterized protein n=1 Tax=Cinara cedri TaxID=506608 RepID=A0A5E4MEL3_9HEMI|nr:Hypothetical protein CINCED_3A007140 [Cinara cedri]
MKNMNTDDGNINEESGTTQNITNILMPIVSNTQDKKVSIKKSCQYSPGYNPSSIRSPRGYILNTDDGNINEESGTTQNIANILMPCVCNTQDKKDSISKICQSAPGYNPSSLRSPKGYILNTDDGNINEESGTIKSTAKILMPCVCNTQDKRVSIKKSCQYSPGYNPSSIRSSRGYILNTDDGRINEESGTIKSTDSILMPSVSNTQDKKVSIKKCCQYSPGYNSSSIRSPRGYILNTDDGNINEESGTIQIAGHTYFSVSSIENSLSMSAGADDEVNTSVTQSYEFNTASTVKKNNTENCLKRFQQEYNELMKQRNEIMSSTEYSVYHTISEISPQPTFNQNIEHDHAAPILLNESIKTKQTGNELNSIETVNKWEDAGFQEKHDLIKERNEKKPEFIEIRSPKTDSKKFNSYDSFCSCESNSCFSAESCKSHSCFSAESCKSNLCFSAESLQLKQTRCQLNPKKTVNMMEIPNSGSNYNCVETDPGSGSTH